MIAAVEGKTRPVNPVRLAGLGILCSYDEQGETRYSIVEQEQAQDQQAFYTMWLKLGGADLRWPDGTPLASP